MGTTMKWGTALAAVLVVASPARAGKDAKDARLAWARSWSDAVQEASERNLPILLHSHAAT